MSPHWILCTHMSFGTMYFVELEDDFTFVENPDKATKFTSKVEAEGCRDFVIQQNPTKQGLHNLKAEPHGFN